MWMLHMQQLPKLKLDITTQLASKSGMQQTNLKYNSYQYKQQMMPRLPGVYLNLSRSSHQTPEVFILQVGSQLSIQFISDWCKKTEKVFLEISHKIHKENTCVRVSFSNFIKRDFGRDFFKRDFSTCFPVNFAKFL